jgi:hypothetical protein
VPRWRSDIWGNHRKSKIRLHPVGFTENCGPPQIISLCAFAVQCSLVVSHPPSQQPLQCGCPLFLVVISYVISKSGGTLYLPLGLLVDRYGRTRNVRRC